MPYTAGADETLVLYDSRLTGLTGTEAANRLKQDGLNVLTEVQSASLVRRYIRQFKDWIIGLLLVSAVILAVIGDVRTSIILGILILFNTLVGFLQEYRAEKTVSALKRLIHPVTEVYRDGKIGEIQSAALVAGDIIHLSEGMAIPADARIIECLSLSTNEFALTGESRPTYKTTAALSGETELSSRKNMVYMGTTVASGSAHVMITATGMRTELGNVASLSENITDDASPLQKETRHIATYVTYGIVALSCVLAIAAALLHIPFGVSLLFIVGMACSIIPQGLPAEISASLSQAAGKLARANALVKRLSAVETLGATHVICTDKTGTLTKNEMTVTRLLSGTSTYGVTGTGYAPNGEIIDTTGSTVEESQAVHRVVAALILANEAKIVEPDASHPSYYCLGDPTEGALVTLAMKTGMDIVRYREQHPEVQVFSFDSTRKRMTSVRRNNSVLTAYVKGAPEAILERSTHILLNGTVVSLSPEIRSMYIAEQADAAANGLRTIAAAYRELETVPAHGEYDSVESNLILLGMAAMADPVRDDVAEAMAIARTANINVVIVTGDLALTAESIARQAGLIVKGEVPSIVTGKDLQSMDDASVAALASKHGTIFARVSPEDKMRIVGLVKESGKVVAVTGDGINDAPALKRADIGVAMGLSGSDVAKQSADLILLDDSFGTLVGAVREGRTIFSNIRKGILSCFTSNIAELVINLCGLALISIFGLAPALNVLQLLAIDLLAEFFPIAALGWDKEEGEQMKDAPRNPKRHILNRHTLGDLFISGSVMGVLGMANYLLYYVHHGYGLFDDAPLSVVYSATTATYVTVVLCQLVNIIGRRSVHGLFTRYQLSNGRFWIAIAGSLCIVIAIAYVPIVSEFFKSGPLLLSDWLYVVAAVVIFALYTQLRRFIPVINDSKHEFVVQ